MGAVVGLTFERVLLEVVLAPLHAIVALSHNEERIPQGLAPDGGAAAVCDHHDVVETLAVNLRHLGSDVLAATVAADVNGISLASLRTSSPN